MRILKRLFIPAILVFTVSSVWYYTNFLQNIEEPLNMLSDDTTRSTLPNPTSSSTVTTANPTSQFVSPSDEKMSAVAEDKSDLKSVPKNEEERKLLQAYTEMKERISTLTQLEITRLVMTGEISSELVDMLNIQISPYDVFQILKPTQSLLKTLAQNKLEKKDFYLTKEGVVISLLTRDVISTHMYDSDSHFSGIMKISDNKDYLQMTIQDISSVEMSTLGGGVSYSVGSDMTGAFFFVGATTSIANIHLLSSSYDEISRLAFPVSTSTKGTLVFKAIGDSLEVGVWNIDFDGDGGTDVSIGSREQLTKEELEIAFDLISKDKKISEKDRTKVALWKNSFLSLVSN
jgi:hypothetical protein